VKPSELKPVTDAVEPMYTPESVPDFNKLPEFVLIVTSEFIEFKTTCCCIKD